MAARGAQAGLGRGSQVCSRRAGELLQITRRTLVSRQDGARLVRLRFDGGVSGRPELRGAESLVAQARANLIALQRQHRLNGNTLALFRGQPVLAELAVPGKLNGVRWTKLPTALTSDMLLPRPDVRQAEQALIAANANIGAARRALPFPAHHADRQRRHR